MIGTLFLWMFWPSFNGALCVSNAQERAIVNTLLSMCGSCVVAFIASHVFRREKKFHMVDMQNHALCHTRPRAARRDDPIRSATPS